MLSLVPSTFTNPLQRKAVARMARQNRFSEKLLANFREQMDVGAGKTRAPCDSLRKQEKTGKVQGSMEPVCSWDDLLTTMEQLYNIPDHMLALSEKSATLQKLMDAAKKKAK